MLVMFPQGNNYITNEYMDSVHRVHKVGISFLALYMDLDKIIYNKTDKKVDKKRQWDPSKEASIPFNL
jgi:hypothetical protein